MLARVVTTWENNHSLEEPTRYNYWIMYRTLHELAFWFHVITPWLKASMSESNLDLPLRDYDNQNLLSLNPRVFEILCTPTVKRQYEKTVWILFLSFLRKFKFFLLGHFFKNQQDALHLSKTALHFSYMFKKDAIQHVGRQGGRDNSTCI